MYITTLGLFSMGVRDTNAALLACTCLHGRHLTDQASLSLSATILRFPISKLTVPTNVLSLNLPVLDVSYKEDNTIFVVLCLAYYI